MPNSLLIERLQTVQVIPLTAYDASGQLALGPLKTLIGRLYEAGVRVFLPAAGSAEFHSLSSSEILASVEATREVVGDDAVVVAPIGRQVHEAIALGNQCRAAGADAMLVMPLAFPYLNDPGARDYFTAIFDGVDAPAMVYKKAAVPTDELLLELADHENLLGVKYAENDIDAFNRIVQDDGGRIQWYCGSAERFSPFFMLAGANGYTSAAANLCPRVCLAMHAAIVAGDWSEAMRIQQIIRPIEDYRGRGNNSYNISFLKGALSHVGLDFGDPRPPQRRLTEAERQEIAEMMPAILSAEETFATATV